MSNLRIIPVDAALSWCLTAIAISAKAHWKYPASWLHTWQEGLTITPAFVKTHPTFACIQAQRVVGFHAVTRSSSTAVLEHLWVLPEAMGQGVGRALFVHAELYSIQSGCRGIEIESDPHAEGFYRRMGAEIIGQRDRSIDGIRRELPVLRKVFPLYTSHT